MLVLFGIALGVCIGLLKADVAGVRGAAGNLVGPWLLPAFVGVGVMASRRTLLLAVWASSASAVVSFYAVQWAVWGLVTASSLPYNTFWALAGATACTAIALAMTFVEHTPARLCIWWGAGAATFSGLYAAYLLTGTDPYPVTSPYALTVLVSVGAFPLLGILAALWISRRPSGSAGR